jgi:hypothetical protein
MFPAVSGSTVIHPNFRVGPGQKSIRSRKRAVMFSTNQETFDFIMNEVDSGRAASSQEVLARALEQYLGLPPGSANLAPSESE